MSVQLAVGMWASLKVEEELVCGERLVALYIISSCSDSYPWQMDSLPRLP
jgi:hypothetical protein